MYLSGTGTLAANSALAWNSREAVFAISSLSCHRLNTHERRGIEGFIQGFIEVLGIITDQ